MDIFIRLKNSLDRHGLKSLKLWQAIQQQCKAIQLKEDENFNCRAGTVAFVAEGILKEYDSRFRTKPAIVNFIAANHFLVTYRGSNHQFFRCCSDCTIIYLENDSQWKLFEQFPEIEALYDEIEGEAYQLREERNRLLELKPATRRIAAFIEQFKAIRPYLRKKDIARYLALDYNLFIRHYNKLS